MTKFLIVTCAIWSFGKAFVIRFRRDLRGIAKNDFCFNTQLSSEEIDFLIKLSDFLVARLAWFSGRKCFYRNYVVHKTLNYWGLQTKLNIGLKNLKTRAIGHCWLTLDDKLFAERVALNCDYAIRVGNNNNIQYWIGVEECNQNQLEVTA